MRSEKEGAYGQSSAVSSIKTYNSYATRNSQVHKLTPKGDILFSREVAYFLIDQNKRSYKASKSTILTVFAKHKTRIGQYIKEESIDFTKEEDLKKLLQFCIQQS